MRYIYGTTVARVVALRYLSLGSPGTGSADCVVGYAFLNLADGEEHKGRAGPLSDDRRRVDGDVEDDKAGGASRVHRESHRPNLGLDKDNRLGNRRIHPWNI